MKFLPFWNRRKVTNTQPGNGLIGRALGEIFYPGADVYAPVDKATDPEISAMGTGYIPMYQWQITQPPQVQAVMIAGQAGLGGSQAGSIYFAPLVDPDTLNPSE